MLTGAETEEQCHYIHCQLTEVLGGAHLPLRKWCSNSPAFLSQLSNDIDVNYSLRLPESETVGTLGILYQPSTNSFRFVMKSWIPPQRMTKRTLLSDINSIYDPMGWVTPVLLKRKIFG